MDQPVQQLPQQQEQPVSPPAHDDKKKIVFLIGTILLVLVVVPISIYFIKGIFISPSDQSPQQKVKDALIPSSTPLPFREITIPYLREKVYNSSLRTLEPYGSNANYSSYLTSYTSDGLKINALLTKPTGEEPEGGWPAIVFIHGYIPPTQYQTTQNYIDYVDYLARNGFVVFKIDLRGHGNSEGEPSGAYYSGDYIIDTLNAYAALQSSGFVHPKKIGLWGHSMAGNVAMRSMAAKPEIPAVVIWAGAVYSYTDWTKYGIQDSSYQPPQMSSERVRRRQQLLNTHGQPSETSIFWQQVAPTNYVKDLKGAIQIHHAVDDAVVDIGYSRDLDNLLQTTDVPHELYEYQSGGHNINGGSFVQAMNRTVEFFKKNLQ